MDAIEINSDDNEAEATQAAIDAAANGDWIDVDEVVGHEAPASASKSAVNGNTSRPGSAKNGAGRAKGRPSGANMLKLQQSKVQQQNRLAKLQALEGDDDVVW